jgi:hypothetical protein
MFAGIPFNIAGVNPGGRLVLLAGAKFVIAPADPGGTRFVYAPADPGIFRFMP